MSSSSEFIPINRRYARPFVATAARALDMTARLVFVGSAVVIYIWLIGKAANPVSMVQLDGAIWYDLAVYKQLLQGPFSAEPNAVLSPQSFTPWTVAVAFFAQQFGLTADGALMWSGILCILVLMLGIYAFASSYWRNPWAPAALLLVLFASWTAQITHSGFYTLNSLAFSPHDSGLAAIALGFLLWASVLRSIRSNDMNHAGLTCGAILTAFVLTTDPFIALFVIGIAVLLALFDRQPAKIVGRALAFGAITAGLILASFWIYFNPIDTIASGPVRTVAQRQGFDHATTSFGDFVAIAGFAIFGMVGFFSTRARGMRWELVVPTALLVVVAMMVGSQSSWLLPQLWALIVLCLQLGLVSFFVQPGYRRAPTVTSDVIRGLLISALAVSFGVNAYRAQTNYMAASFYLDDGVVPEGHANWHGDLRQVVATAEDMASDGGKVLAFGHTALPFMTSTLQPIAIDISTDNVLLMSDGQLAVSAFFSQTVSNRMQCDILQSYSIDVIVHDNTLSSSLRRKIERFGTPTRMGDLTLIDVDANSTC